MVNVINLKETMLSDFSLLDKDLSQFLNMLHESVKAKNEVWVTGSKYTYTSKGRALFSLLEELTGNVISKDYCLQKLGMLFDE